jgi:hypothetical protein
MTGASLCRAVEAESESAHASIRGSPVGPVLKERHRDKGRDRAQVSATKTKDATRQILSTQINIKTLSQSVRLCACLCVCGV